MIREPTVGMRVKIIAERYVGECGTIIKPWFGGFKIALDSGKTYIKNIENLTEIKEIDVKKGDLVTIHDWSYIVRVDRFEGQWSYDTDKHETWEVIETRDNCLQTNHSKSTVHDIIIQSTPTGRIYLHSSGMVTLAKPKVKELTVADIEEMVGCKVKIVK